LNFNNDTKEEGMKFKEESLPDGAIASLKSRRIGVSRSDPDKDPKPGDAGSGALTDAAAGGGSANTQVVLPRHRGTVQRFFDRPVEPKK
jgi:hypothetical protein